jgi:2'-5' RNA ligase
MRLFTAIELPDDAKRELARLRVDIPEACWVPVDQIHLTLSFLGEVEEGAIEQLIWELARIRVPEFQLWFSGTGCFPDHRRPRVLWIGLEPEPCLKKLAAQVREAILACGIPQEERFFSPHITLARLKIPASKEPGVFLDQHKKLRLPVLRVQNFTLFLSRLTPQGAVHNPIRSFSLGASRVCGEGV